jgi:hypothetical protein
MHNILSQICILHYNTKNATCFTPQGTITTSSSSPPPPPPLLIILLLILLLLLTFTTPLQVLASSFLRFWDHTQWHKTVGRTSLDEWWARRRDLYLTNTQHSQQTNFYAPSGIRTHNPSKRSAADRSATGLGSRDHHWGAKIKSYCMRLTTWLYARTHARAHTHTELTFCTYKVLSKSIDISYAEVKLNLDIQSLIKWGWWLLCCMELGSSAFI